MKKTQKIDPVSTKYRYKYTLEFLFARGPVVVLADGYAGDKDVSQFFDSSGELIAAHFFAASVVVEPNPAYEAPTQPKAAAPIPDSDEVRHLKERLLEALNERACDRARLRETASVLKHIGDIQCRHTAFGRRLAGLDEIRRVLNDHSIVASRWAE